jgi:hypothetical protein
MVKGRGAGCALLLLGGSKSTRVSRLGARGAESAHFHAPGVRQRSPPQTEISSRGASKAKRRPAHRGGDAKERGGDGQTVSHRGAEQRTQDRVW